jgi:uncharacterized iron-regulated membrane protein
MRRALVQLHLWLGLTIGLLWALQGLSGAWLVFHRDLERVGVAVAPGPMVSLDTVIANAQAARPGEAVIRVSVADAAGGLLNADFGGKGDGVKVEAATGRVIRTDPRPIERANLILYHLHEELLAGETGRFFIGLSGLLLLSATLMGVWLGWPRRGTWRVAFNPVRWTTPRLKLYGWHRAAGLLAALALVVGAASGATMIFNQELRLALTGTTFYAPVYRAKPVEALPVTMIAPDAAWQVAHEVFPDARFVRLTMPSRRAPVYHLRMLKDGELRTWSGTTAVTVDPVSGRVLAAYDATRAPIGNLLLDAAFALHSGEVGGVAGRVLIVLAGLSLPLFYVTGVLAWWRKRKRRVLRVDALAPATI